MANTGIVRVKDTYSVRRLRGEVGDYIRIKTMEEMDVTYNGEFTKSIRAYDSYKDSTCPVSFEGHMTKYLGGTYKILSIVDKAGRKEYNLDMDINLRWLEDWLVELDQEEEEDMFVVKEHVRVKTEREMSELYGENFLETLHERGRYIPLKGELTFLKEMVKYLGGTYEVTELQRGDSNSTTKYILEMDHEIAWQGDWLVRCNQEEPSPPKLGDIIDVYQKSDVYADVKSALDADMMGNIPNYKNILGFMVINNGDILVMYEDIVGNTSTYLYEKEGK